MNFADTCDFMVKFRACGLQHAMLMSIPLTITKANPVKNSNKTSTMSISAHPDSVDIVIELSR